MARNFNDRVHTSTGDKGAGEYSRSHPKFVDIGKGNKNKPAALTFDDLDQDDQGSSFATGGSFSGRGTSSKLRKR